MKKIISLIFAVLLISSSLFLTVSARESITFSEDFKTLYYGGTPYLRFDDTYITTEYYGDMNDDAVELTQSQQETVKSVSLSYNEGESIIWATINYIDGSTLKSSYLNKIYYDEYNEIINGETDEYQINFDYPEDNYIYTQKNNLFGSKYTLTAIELSFCDECFSVNAVASNENFYCEIGAMLIVNDEFYYVDYKEAEIEKKDEYFSFFPADYTRLEAYKITDMELSLQIEDAMQKYYSDDLGIFFDDDFTESVANIFLIVIFAVIPFAIFVTFLILALRSKTVYKKFFTVICALSASELFIFAVVTIYLLTLK